MAKSKKQISPISPEGYSYQALKSLLEITLEENISALVLGHPGVGKSTLAMELAEEAGLPMHDIRLAQREPAELCGVYFPNRDSNTLELFPPAWVKAVCEKPGFVFLDEINAAVTRLHQAAAYQIVLERRVGPHRFHPETRVMAAGNLEEDNALVVGLSSALNNRFAHYKLKVDVKSWLAWAEQAGLAPEIISYIRANQRFGADILYNPNEEGAFASPRSWAMASRLYQRAPEEHRQRLVVSCIGTESALKFFNYLKLYHRVKPADLIMKGKKIQFETGRNADPSFAHATMASVGSWLAEQPTFDSAWSQNLVELMQSPGLDPEHAFVLLRDIKARTSALSVLKESPAYRSLAADLVQLHTGLYA